MRRDVRLERVKKKITFGKIILVPFKVMGCLTYLCAGRSWNGHALTYIQSTHSTTEYKKADSRLTEISAHVCGLLQE